MKSSSKVRKTYINNKKVVLWVMLTDTQTICTLINIGPIILQQSTSQKTQIQKMLFTPTGHFSI